MTLKMFIKLSQVKLFYKYFKFNLKISNVIWISSQETSYSVEVCEIKRIFFLSLKKWNFIWKKTRTKKPEIEPKILRPDPARKLQQINACNLISQDNTYRHRPGHDSLHFIRHADETACDRWWLRFYSFFYDAHL